MKLNPGDFTNSREMLVFPKKKTEPPVDEVISKIVGKKVFAQDPKLIKLVVKHKGNKSVDSKTPDNFLHKPQFIADLKKTFGSIV